MCDRFITVRTGHVVYIHHTHKSWNNLVSLSELFLLHILLLAVKEIEEIIFLNAELQHEPKLLAKSPKFCHCFKFHID